MVNVSLFLQLFLPPETVCSEKITAVGRAIDRFVHGIEKHFGGAPCSITSIGLSADFGAIGRRFDQE